MVLNIGHVIDLAFDLKIKDEQKLKKDVGEKQVIFISMTYTNFWQLFNFDEVGPNTIRQYGTGSSYVDIQNLQVNVEC